MFFTGYGGKRVPGTDQQGAGGLHPRQGILYHQRQYGTDPAGRAADVQYGYLRRTVLPEFPVGAGAECPPERLLSPRKYRDLRDDTNTDQREIRDVCSGADPASANQGAAGGDPPPSLPDGGSFRTDIR